MTPIEGFLTVVGLGSTFILGYIGRYWQYEWNKKSLRDKKFLEGRILAYSDLYEWAFKANVYSGLYFQYLSDNNKDKIEYYTKQIEDLHTKEFPKIITKAYFYTNKDVEINIREITGKVENAWKEGYNILLPSLNTGIVTDEQKQRFFSHINEIDEALNDYLKMVREDLGFEKKQKRRKKAV